MSAYLTLAKPKITLLVMAVALASAFAAAQGFPSTLTVLLLTLAVGAASAGAAYINNYWDRDIDRLMARTRHRPVPSGRISPRRVLFIGSLLVAVSVPLSLALNYLVAIFVLAGALIYIFIYTLWLKRRTSVNIIVGGLSGSFAILAGWFAITRSLSLLPLLVAVLVFLWTPSHFWCLALAHRRSYSRASVPMLPSVTGFRRSAAAIFISSSLMVAVSLVPYFTGLLGTWYFAGAALLGAGFLFTNVLLLFSPGKVLAWLNFKLSGIYLLLVFVAMVADVLATGL